MIVHFTRKTGFYGMATPIEVMKNGERWFLITNNSEKMVEVNENEVEVQVRFYFMKSDVFLLANNSAEKELEIKMNPILVSNYLFFFFLILVARGSYWGVLILLALYCIFLFSVLKKAYVIKEKTDGT
ncbi:hypothetical protein IW492_04780 [Enterococcus sp. BWB1-3]|uniref:hypothetical protein n=1 Tax=unclassified Enterococcus TaxID=2608891 RepID=UPI001922CD10|nr:MULTISPECIES: hypothetical protein [unclassified Enterococcus]MBL1228547.1 hypothetical protein [Enterococcus sp. BWB1-3]MCB5955877.1 hypothetical protein [Enterococcus sp. CWB-B31]